MKKLCVFLVLLLSFSLLAVTQFVPANYDQLLIAKNNGDHYTAAKKIQLLDIVMNGLGIEPMVQGLLASSVVQYGATVEQLNDLLSKDTLVIFSGQDFTAVLGPSKYASKLIKAISGILGSGSYVAQNGDYLLISSSPDLLQKCQKGGGKIPEEVMKQFDDSSIWAVIFSPKLTVEDATFSMKGTIRVLKDRLSGESTIYAENEKAKALLKDMRPSKNFDLYKDKNIGGEIFVFGNVSNFVSLNNVYQTLNLSDLLSKVPATLSATETQAFEKQFEGLMELSSKLTGQLAFSVKVSNLLEGLLAPQQEQAGQAMNPVFYGVVGGEIKLEELQKSLAGQIKTSKNLRYLDLDGVYVTSENGKIKFYSSVPTEFSNEKGSLDKVLKLYDPEKMPIFLCVDFAPILEKLLGMNVESLFVLTSSVDDKAFTVNWYLK
ncbi:hypothetical protein ACSFC1_03230 [Pseudothermotoga sp. U03pept]|uniref:hypothetical protein n=1 Tax=Pseudothermotoga sp. U03pept TaxID=3447012 RepID=UPI003F04F8E3